MNLGALLVTRLDSSAASGRRLYSLAFVRPGAERPRPGYRCDGDAHLLRVLEDLVEAPERRLAALDRLRADGVALIRDVALSPGQVVASAPAM